MKCTDTLRNYINDDPLNFKANKQEEYSKSFREKKPSTTRIVNLLKL